MTSAEAGSDPALEPIRPSGGGSSGRPAGHVQMRDSQYANGEVARAIAMLEGAGFKQPAVEDVLLQSGSLRANDAAFVSAISGVVQTLAVQKNVQDIQNPMALTGGGGH